MIKATLETILMSIAATFLAYVLAIPLAIITNESRKTGMMPNKCINLICNIVIGVGRSIPFVILAILIMPITRAILGTSIGTTASIIPLTVSAVPFIARNIELSLNKVEQDVIEAATLSGASNFRIIFQIKFGSRMYDLIENLSVTMVSIIDYSTMVSVIGGGGLGAYAITNGYYKYQWSVVAVCTLILLVLILTVQITSRTISKKYDWRKHR